MCSHEFSDGPDEESAFGFKSFQVAPKHSDRFFDGLLKLFGISHEEFHRKQKNRQETVLTGLSRFGLKPAEVGAFKWKKAYDGEVPFVCDLTKKLRASKKGKKSESAERDGKVTQCRTFVKLQRTAVDDVGLTA